MYKIIGADRREYGPVSADQIREWIAQGRANGQTLAQAEGSGAWNPLSAYPDFAEALASQAGQPVAAVPAPAAGAPPEKLLEQDYRVDIFGCVGRAWDLIREDFGSIVGTTLLIVVITMVINQCIGYFTKSAFDSLFHGHFDPRSILTVVLASLASAPIYAVFNGGLYWFLLKKIRGEEAGVGDAFAGFGSAFGQLALLGFVKGLLSIFAFALCVAPFIYLSVAWAFAEPLVIDKRLGFWEAMELSRKRVTQHWLTVFCLLLVTGIVIIAGLVGCCIGIIVTIPIGLAALMFAYEDIFRH